MEAEPRTTMARSVGSPSHIVSSCRVPMTLTSWRVARGRPGSGNWTMSLWTTVSTAAARTAGVRSGLRRSAWTTSMRSARSRSTARVSTPTTRSTPASLARRRASRAPNAFATPVMRTRRPATRALRSGRGGRRLLGRRTLGRRGAPARGGASRLERLDASLERRDALAQRGELVGARGPQVLERLTEAPGGGHELVGDLLGALARDAGLSGRRLDGLRRGRPHGVAAALLAVRLGVPLLLAGVLLGQGATSLSSPAVAHLHPTAELAERALLPDDPGQALALTLVLYEETPRMFNHHRGLWGYTGVALDGAPLTVQSTGIGGPSAAIVVGELHGLGLRRGVRIGRAWALDGALRAGELVAATAVLAHDGTSRALGAGERIQPDRPPAAPPVGGRAGPRAARRAGRRSRRPARLGRRRAARRRGGCAGLRPRERRGPRGGGAGGDPRGVPGGDRGRGRARRGRRPPRARRAGSDRSR